jgi:hypothetical protein
LQFPRLSTLSARQLPVLRFECSAAVFSAASGPASVRRNNRCYNPGSFVWITTMTRPACPHKRTQLIAKDNDAQYVECLDCGEILEAGELEKPEGAGFDESLSDA